MKLVAEGRNAPIRFGTIFILDRFRIEALRLRVIDIGCIFYLFKIEERKLEDAMCSITGIFYVSFFAYHIVLVDQTGEYRLLV